MLVLAGPALAQRGGGHGGGGHGGCGIAPGRASFAPPSRVFVAPPSRTTFAAPARVAVTPSGRVVVNAAGRVVVNASGPVVVASRARVEVVHRRRVFIGAGIGFGVGFGYWDYPFAGYAPPEPAYGNGNGVIPSDGGYADQAPYGGESDMRPEATIEVRLPDPQGEVWFNGQKVSGSGTVRRFVTPPLQPGQYYHYIVAAAWFENSRLMADEVLVDIMAGSSAVIDFTQPPSEEVPAAPRTPAAPK
jgi:uncharacterized protein (TIGR03000 family)